MNCYNKITKKTYDTVSENWEAKRQYPWKPVITFLETFTDKKNLKFLDLGCGTGRHLELADKLGFEKENLVGCDFSKGQLSIVKKKDFKTQLGELTKLPFENNSFDVIVCIAAHHHLLEKEEQLKSLCEMKRVLKEKGKLLLSNWFVDNDFIKKQEEKGKFEFIDAQKQKVKVTYTSDNKKYDRYYYLFKENELLELCNKANLKLEKTEYDNKNLYLTLV